MKFLKNHKYLFTCLLIALSLSIFVFYKESKKLTDFKIINFEQDVKRKENINLLKWSSSKNAVKYRVAVLNENMELLKTVTTDDTSININTINVETDEKVIIDVMAYDKNGNSLKAPDLYETEWSNPTIEKKELKNGIINNQDLKLNILHHEKDDFKGYYILLKKDDKTLFKKHIQDDEVIIPKSILEVLYGEYKLELDKIIDNDEIIIDSTKINIELPNISDIEVTYPTDKNSVRWDDFNITFDGGNNATNYYMSLSDEYNNVIFENENVINKSKSIDITTLRENTTYNLTIKAVNYLDRNIEKTITTTFTTKEKEDAQKVVTDYNENLIHKGDYIRLSSNTMDADIYYTTNGQTPTINSLKYTDGIKVDNDMTIKAIAIRKNMYDSDISEFNYRVYDKSNSIYLSPSTQYKNFGVASVGYTTEREMMNKVADYTEKVLTQRGVKVYRNNPNMTLEEVVKDSSKKDISLHLAIHSNASSLDRAGSQHGVETWYFDSTCIKQMEFARVLQNAVMDIYYDKKANRGIKDSSIMGGLYEISPRSVHNGVLIEVAFHDNKNDAKWIVDNIELIGTTIGNATASYLGK